MNAYSVIVCPRLGLLAFTSASLDFEQINFGLATGESGVHLVNHLSNILTHHLIGNEDNHRDRGEYQCILSHRLSAPQRAHFHAHSFDRSHIIVLLFRLWTTFDVAQSVCLSISIPGSAA
jgi:hypothetical protein